MPRPVRVLRTPQPVVCPLPLTSSDHPHPSWCRPRRSSPPPALCAPVRRSNVRCAPPPAAAGPALSAPVRRSNARCAPPPAAATRPELPTRPHQPCSRAVAGHCSIGLAPHRTGCRSPLGWRLSPTGRRPVRRPSGSPLALCLFPTQLGFLPHSIMVSSPPDPTAKPHLSIPLCQGQPLLWTPVIAQQHTLCGISVSD